MVMPTQYTAGTAYFMDFEFAVNPYTFIPRPETELLVERTLEFLPKAGKTRILDLCTGSGAIAISLAKYDNKCKIIALDISQEALATACQNAESCGVANRILFVRSDMFGAARDEEGIDIVVSNPPYVSERDMAFLPPEVMAEPRIALYGGKAGLDFFGIIVKKAWSRLKKDGILLMEMGYNQSAEVVCMLKAAGYRAIELFKDYAGIERIVKALK